MNEKKGELSAEFFAELEGDFAPLAGAPRHFQNPGSTETLSVAELDEQIAALVAEYEEHDAARKQAREVGDSETEILHSHKAMRLVTEAMRLTKLKRKMEWNR